MAGASISPAEVRGYANLPSEVPDALLATHISIAWRALVADTGREDAPADHVFDWGEAQIVRALASVFPWLNTFALEGAAKVGRMEGSVDFRFLDPTDVEARIDALMVRYRDLVTILSTQTTTDVTPGSVAAGGLSLIAI